MIVLATEPSINIDLTGLPHVVNDVYWDHFNNAHRILALVGSAGSGKSVWAAQKVILRTLAEANHHIAAFRKVGRTCKSSVFAQLLSSIEMMGVGELFRINKTDLTLTCWPNGNMIRCLGLDDPEKIKSIVDPRGNNLTSAWCEEATELSENDFNQINLRLRGRTANYKQLILSFNPISALHWLKKRFFDKQDDRVDIVHTTYKDNVFLDDEYVRELEGLEEIDEQLYRIYALGLWGMLKGLIYKPFDVATIWPLVFDDTWYCLDFGYNHPMALAELNTLDADVYIKELFYETGFTISRLAELLPGIGVPLGAIIHCDAARPDCIDELQSYGYNAIACPKGPGSVFAGINFVKRHTLLSHPHNSYLHKEQQSYKWREDKNGNTLEEPVKFHDHLMDAVRYGIVGHLQKVIRFGVS